MDVAAQNAQGQASSARGARLWAGTIFSVLFPGTGHLLIGRFSQAVVFLILYMGFLSLFWPFHVIGAYYGFVAMVVFAWVLPSTASWNFLVMSERRFSKWWLLLLVPVSVAAFITLSGNLGLRLSGYKVFAIPSGSMEPTVVIGDRIMADMRYFESHGPTDGQLAIFQHRGQFLIKRIIATPGDVVTIKNNVVMVNNKVLSEPYVMHQLDGEIPEGKNFGPYRVPADEVFLLGDNRDISLDSRSQFFGAVTIGDLKGKPLYVFSRSKESRIGVPLD